MKLIRITDTHLVPRGEMLLGLNPRERLDACVEDINRHHADAELCVITGDLAHLGIPKAYRDLREILVWWCSQAFGRVGDMTILGIGFREQSLVPAIPADQGIASRTIHQLAHAIQNAAVNAVIVLDIAHPLVVDFVGPVRMNGVSRRQPHEEVALRRRIEDPGVEHDNRRHGQ